MSMKKNEQGFSFIEVLISLLLLSLGISALVLVLMKCKVMGIENEWRSKTLMMAIGIREAIQVQKQLQKQLQKRSMESVQSMSGQRIDKDFNLDIKGLDLKAWQEVLNENFKGSSIEIEHEDYHQKINESKVKKCLDDESKKQEGYLLSIFFIPAGINSGVSKSEHRTQRGLKILRYSCAY